MQTIFGTMTEQYTIAFARAFIGLLLLISGLAKLGNLHEFVQVVRNYKLLPENISGVVARLLPVVEIIVAVGLLLGILVVRFSLVAIGLFLMFGSAVAINLLRGRRDISCGCFGPKQNQLLAWSFVARNAILAGLATVISVLSPTLNTLEQLPIAEMVATTLVAGSVLACWWMWGMILKFWHLPEAASHDQQR